MQTVIHTQRDLEKLQGKFVLCVDSTEPDKELMDFKWGFAKEKRLKMVIGLTLVDLYGYVHELRTFDNFKNVFNQYLFQHMIEEGKPDGGRFHRLLTNRELDYLVEKMKEENY